MGQLTGAKVLLFGHATKFYPNFFMPFAQKKSTSHPRQLRHSAPPTPSNHLIIFIIHHLPKKHPHLLTRLTVCLLQHRTGSNQGKRRTKRDYSIQIKAQKKDVKIRFLTSLTYNLSLNLRRYITNGYAAQCAQSHL